MMAEPEIKLEFDCNDRTQCNACLSVGRKLVRLGEYEDIYKKIIYDNGCASSPDLVKALEICWECQALLQKVKYFQCKVKKASQLLNIGENYIHGALSNLTMIIVNDSQTHIVYINDSLNDIPKIYNDDSKIIIENNYNHEDNDNRDFDEGTDIKSEIEDTKDNERKRAQDGKVSRWAQKRAELNKKPKFNIIKHSNFNEIINKVSINDVELKIFLGIERNGDIYKSSKYKCEKCVLGFKKKDLLVEHYKCHEKCSGKYICDVCCKRFTKKRLLSTHIVSHYYKYFCSVCEWVCINEEQARRHAKDHEVIFECLKCRLRYGSRREFFKHYKDRHEKFICDYCGIAFKMRYSIKDHIRKQHSILQCDNCDARFRRYNALWLHRKLRHASSSAAYCVECDKNYPDVYRYKWHLANSAKHKPRKKVRIPCPGCDKVFTKNIYMKDHYNLVHLKNYKYRCEDCDKNFIRNADLVNHKRRIHEGILPPKNKICYLCGRGFTTNKILVNHVRTHTGERPHACTLCPARFIQKIALVSHIRAVHKPEKNEASDTNVSTLT